MPTSRVELERLMGSINSNRNWTNCCKGSHQFSFVSRWNVNKTIIDSTTVFRVVTASIILK